jgi:hypothetical protein
VLVTITVTRTHRIRRPTSASSSLARTAVYINIRRIKDVTRGTKVALGSKSIIRKNLGGLAGR